MAKARFADHSGFRLPDEGVPTTPGAGDVRFDGTNLRLHDGTTDNTLVTREQRESLSGVKRFATDDGQGSISLDSFQPANRVLNGSFEADDVGVHPPSDWAEYTGTVAISDDDYFDGGKCAKIAAAQANGTYIEQILQARIGQYLRVSVAAYTNTASHAQLLVQYDEGLVRTTLISAYHSGGGSWEILGGTDYVVQIPATATTTNVYISLLKTTATADDIYFDQVVAEVLTYTPWPQGNFLILVGSAVAPSSPGEIRYDGERLILCDKSLNVRTVPVEEAVQDLIPDSDDTRYVGQIAGPFKAFKGLILKDTADGKHYLIQVTNGVVNTVALD